MSNLTISLLTVFLYSKPNKFLSQQHCKTKHAILTVTMVIDIKYFAHSLNMLIVF